MVHHSAARHSLQPREFLNSCTSFTDSLGVMAANKATDRRGGGEAGRGVGGAGGGEVFGCGVAYGGGGSRLPLCFPAGQWQCVAERA